MSMWMSDKRYFELSTRDVAIRLDLIAKVHGIEEAEKYFNQIHKKLRSLEAHSALLNGYVNAKSVEKAEALFQKMHCLGLARTSWAYNTFLNLYYQTGNYKKLDTLIHEMEEKGISFDKFSFGIQLSAYAAASDVEGMDKVLKKMESYPDIFLDWSSYGVAASCYKKAGRADKAFDMLKKSERLIKNSTKRGIAFEHLITLYAALGKKNEVERLRKGYNETTTVYNKGYTSMITSILKFDDFQQAEKIFEKWESRNSTFDIRIPNLLIGAYCKKGLLEKAESLKNKLESEGKKPDAGTWFHFATGYIRNNEPQKVIEAMKLAISVCKERWGIDKRILVAILEYLKKKDEVVGAEEILELLRDKNLLALDVHDKLFLLIRDVKSSLEELKESIEDAFAGNTESLEHSTMKDVNTDDKPGNIDVLNAKFET